MPVGRSESVNKPPKGQFRLHEMSQPFMNQHFSGGPNGSVQGMPPPPHSSGPTGMMPGQPAGPSLNGPMLYGGQNQRPPGPPAPGNYGMPAKPLPGSVPNGPSMGNTAGPQGDPFALRNGFPQAGGMGGGPPPPPGGQQHGPPHQMGARGPPSGPTPTSQPGITGQMGAMSMSGPGMQPPPRPGMPPPPQMYGHNTGFPGGQPTSSSVNTMMPNSSPMYNNGPTHPGPTHPGPTHPGPTHPGPTHPGPTHPGPTGPPPTAVSTAPPSFPPHTAGMQLPGMHQPPPPGAQGSQPGMFPPPPGGQVSQPGMFPPPPGGQVSQPGMFPPPPGGQVSQPGMFPPPPGAQVSQPGMFPPPPGPGGNQPPNSMMGGIQQPPPPPISMAGGMYNQNYPSMGGNYPQQPGTQPPLTPPGAQGGFGYPAPGPGGYPAPPGGMTQRAPSPGVGMSGPTQQPRKLDPDNMPSPAGLDMYNYVQPEVLCPCPIQVMETDADARTGVFQTGSRGGLPPLCTSHFTVEDMGNASPRFIRSTLYNVPVSSDMLNTAKIPFAVTITPFAELMPEEHQPPIVDLGQIGPIRCNRCKAYMCPYMAFVDGGRRFQCAFCNCATEVPAEYFAHLDHTGRRTDYFERPELCLGTYEMVATTDYCKDNKLPNPPAFIFMIDVSYNSVKSGLVHLWCEKLKEEILYNLPKDYGAEESEIRVGFVTYHKELHFYNVKGSLAQPQMMVVSDIEDVFVPLLDGFLVKLSESEPVIDTLLSQIPEMFAESRETEIVLGPVIQAGLDALKSAECAGKLFIFHSSLPVAPAPGSLKNRDDRKLLGTDKEKTILTPQSNFYTGLGGECAAAGCGVELFLFPNSYIDVATVAEVPRLTGGGVHKYQYFQADLDGERLMADLRRQVEKPVAFDCVMRVRTSTGIRPVDFWGNFSMQNTTDVELANMDCDKAVTVEIKHDDKLSEADGAFLQAAVLYTSVGGVRRLRVINLSFNVCSQMADLFRSCELDTFINYMAKHALRSALNSSPKQVREHIMTVCAAVLACYRQKCASPSSAGQLILPEGMKLLPVYSNCVLKSNMLQGGGDISTDDRSWLMYLVNAMPVTQSQVFFYPRLIPLHTLDVESTSLPVAIRCSYDRLQDSGAYLIENGLTMMLWVGLNIDHQWLEDVFSVQSAAQIDIDKTVLQELDNPMSKRVNALIQKIREERKKFLKLVIVRQRDKLEPLFQQYLVEDRSSSGTASYVDFLCHIHKEIRNLLN